MIKRSSGFFKIAFFIFCLFIALFLILFSLTDIRNYVTTETCILIFCLSITIIPLIIELIIYSFGILTNGIRISSKEDVSFYKPMKNSKVPYAAVNDNGTEKMMFFCDKGKIAILSAHNTNIIWDSPEDKIIIKSKFGECFSIFKGIYGVKYENVECDVYTTLHEDGSSPATAEQPSAPPVQAKTSISEENTSANGNVELDAPNDTIAMHNNAVSSTAVNNHEHQHNEVPSQQGIQQSSFEEFSVSTDVPIYDTGVNYMPVMETVEEFDYSINETDKLFEETINL